MTQSIHKTIRRKQWVMLALWILVLMPILLGLSLALSQNHQSKQLTRISSNILHQMGLKIGQVQGSLNSIVSTHFAIAGDQAAIASMAERLRFDNPDFTALGRYEDVPVSQREAFELSLAKSGLYDFRITDLDGTQRVPAPVRAFARPISVIDPMSPELLPFLGSDLAANGSLQTRLTNAIGRNHTVFACLPGNSPASGHILALRPAYRGRVIPANSNSRVQQADGGYLLIINPRDYLDQMLDETSKQQISSVTLGFDVESQKIVESQFESDKQLFANWFAPRVFSDSLTVGDTSLQLDVEGKSGIPANHFIYSCLFILVSTFLFLAALSRAQEHMRTLAIRQQNQQLIHKERDQTTRTLHMISDAVISVDNKGLVQHVNAAGLRFLDCQAKEPIDKPLDQFLNLWFRNDPIEQFVISKCLKELTVEEPLVISLIPEQDQDQDEITQIFQCTASLNDRQSTGETTAVFVFRDVSSEVLLSEALEHQATHDFLTGSANRQLFESELVKLCRSKARNNPGSALLYVDLDQFKVINDTCGHKAGDMMLVQLTRELNQIIKASDLLARLGGDEFGVLMRGVDAAEAEQRAQHILEHFKTMVFSFEQRGFPVRASLGLVHFDETDHSAKDLLAAADMACYAAKDLGRNRLYVYHSDDENMQIRTTELKWLPLLRQALEDNLFELYAQPLMSIKTPGKFSHYEVLLRLRDNRGRDLQVSKVVQAAERYGIMCEIDRWVINTTFSYIAKQDLNKDRSTATYSINLSGQSAADSTLVDFIRDRIKYFQINPQQLCFEITETAAISHFSNAVELAVNMRELGIQMALDDFGSGLSSFSYLKHLPFDILKIDGQFVKGIVNNPVDLAMVKAIRDVAHSMQITTVAEFVEDQDILDVLTHIGIDIAQGFHLGKPVPIEQVLSVPSSVKKNPKADSTRVQSVIAQ